jgi:hypothetical protein
MKIDIQTLRPKQHRVAFAYSSKERMEFSKMTIEPALAEEGYDVYWIDGSVSEQGRAFPSQYTSADRLCEIHLGVGGGADLAILYAVSYLLDKGYDYIGLIENDVKLQPGWFACLMGLFEQGARDGLKVGAVSARCYTDRQLVPRDNYQVMVNLGAGMVLFAREALLAVLDKYRTGVLGEVSFLFGYYAGSTGEVPWQIAVPSVADIPQRPLTGDWFYETSFLAKGMVALACTPSMAHNIDEDAPHKFKNEATRADPAFDWPGFCQRLNRVAAQQDTDPVRAIIPHYDPAHKHWRAYPHHIIKALPGAFKGDWKFAWSRSVGPFGMMTTKPGASLRLPLHGLGLKLLINNYEKALTLHVRGTFGEGTISVPEKSGWHPAYINLAHSGPHEIEITFDQPRVMLSCLVFEGPQSWFRAGYDLRFEDLEPYIE